MARAVVGGLVTSTFLTLLVVPVVYTLLDDFAGWMRRRWGGKKAAAVVAAGFMVLFQGISLLAPPAAVAADADGVEVLTLDDVVRITLENNRDIRKALELRNTMEGRYVEERAAALPQLIAAARGSRSWDTTQEAFGIPPGNTTVGAQLGVTSPCTRGARSPRRSGRPGSAWPTRRTGGRSPGRRR